MPQSSQTSKLSFLSKTYQDPTQDPSNAFPPALYNKRPSNPNGAPPADGQPALVPLRPEIRSVVQLTLAHASKVYFSGPLVKRLERQPDGQRPIKDEGWVDVWAQLGGTTLSIWDMREVEEASREGREVPPTYINITDAFVQAIGSITVPATNGQPPKKFTNVLTLNTAGSNLLLFSCPSPSILISWVTTLRLSAWEKSRLEEIYTAHLIRLTLPGGRDTHSTLQHGRMEGWVRIRIAGQTDWNRMWMVVSAASQPDAPGPSYGDGAHPGMSSVSRMKRVSSYFLRDQSEDLPPRPLLSLYASSKSKDKKKTLLTLRDVTQAFAVYPERPELINRSTLMKLEGLFGNEETAGGMKGREGWLLVMPELEAGDTQALEMLKWLVALHDAFELYGRPKSYTWDPRDPISMMFAYPVGPARDLLFLDRELAETVDPRDDRTSTIRSRLLNMLHERMSQIAPQSRPDTPPALPTSSLGTEPLQQRPLLPPPAGQTTEQSLQIPRLPSLNFDGSSSQAQARSGPADSTIGRVLIPITELSSARGTLTDMARIPVPSLSTDQSHGSQQVSKSEKNEPLAKFVDASASIVHESGEGDLILGWPTATRPLPTSGTFQGFSGDSFGRGPGSLPGSKLSSSVENATKLEKLGDSAMNSKNYDAAIGYYSNALPLDPMNMTGILIKCCKARVGLLEEALVQADKDIERDTSSYRGYKRKRAVLHRMGRHREASKAFEMMLSKLEQSPDPHIRKLRDRYVDATPAIRRIVQYTIRHMPRVLINTSTGHLHDKARQAAAFERLPIFHELRSSMITRVEDARIRKEVKRYYRYVMFSHKWEDGEPLFQTVEDISIYDLEPSSPNIKLQTFCTLARSLGFQWVWSDTCCIDKKDNVVLQESLVAMFTWYRGSSLTIIYLRGVWSRFQKPGDLRRSIWNTRAWTYQEYVAAEIVQFYTEDWKPYLGLTVYNHKESPAIISEMQQATSALSQELAVLRPDLGRVREKLYVASMRETTYVEDIAYSLLGIFNAAIPVIYGEGNRAVGRLLEHVLTGSGDITILAWTGHAGSYNSCLPTDLTVYNELAPPHIPQPIEMAEMDRMVTALCSSLTDLSLAVTLHGRLNELPSPSLAASRLRLHSIVFPVTDFVHMSESDSDSDFYVYRATTAVLGDVEIKTMDDLSGTEDFILIHPWISPLLDQDFSRRAIGVDATTRALRLVARLRQPFGALLLAPLSRVQYRRVAADSLIMVQVREETSLTELMDGIRPIDIQ